MFEHHNYSYEGLNEGRRRRNADGKRIMRHRRSSIRRRKRMAEEELHINEVIDKNPKGSYVRFQNKLGQVIVADHKGLVQTFYQNF